MLRALNVNEIHRTFDDSFTHQKAFVNSRQDIDQRIADRQRVKADAFNSCEIYWRHAKAN